MPVILSEQTASASLFLDKFEDEILEIHILGLYGEDLNNLRSVKLFELTPTTPLSSRILNEIPTISIRDENVKSMDIVKDMPLATEITMHRNNEGDLATEAYEKYLEEEKGKTWEKRYEEYMRTWDSDTVSIAKLGYNAEVVNKFFQSRDHRFREDKSVRQKNYRSRYQVATLNNMVTNKITNNVLTSFVPESILYNDDEIATRELYMQVLSFKDIIRRKRISINEVQVRQFIEEKLNGIDLISNN